MFVEPVRGPSCESTNSTKKRRPGPARAAENPCGTMGGYCLTTGGHSFGGQPRDLTTGTPQKRRVFYQRAHSTDGGKLQVRLGTPRRRSRRVWWDYFFRGVSPASSPLIRGDDTRHATLAKKSRRGQQNLEKDGNQVLLGPCSACWIQPASLCGVPVAGPRSRPPKPSPVAKSYPYPPIHAAGALSRAELMNKPPNPEVQSDERRCNRRQQARRSTQTLTNVGGGG